jgi:membrane protein
MAARFRIYLIQASFWARLWQLLKAAGNGLSNNNSFGIAKAAAYSALLSFFPVLTTLAAILVQARAEQVSHTIASFLYDVVPPGSEDVVRTLFVVHGQRPTSLLVGAVILAVWAASGAMSSLMEGFRATYHIPSGRPFLREQSMAILLVFVSAAPLLGASALIVFGTRAESAVVSWLHLRPEGASLDTGFRGWVSLGGQVLGYAIALGTLVLVTTLIYYLGPNRRQTFRRVLPGAGLATLLWSVATLGFGWYVRHVANYNVLYGSVGAGLALLVWMYLLAVIMLFGCEFNAARERMLGAPSRS